MPPPQVSGKLHSIAHFSLLSFEFNNWTNFIVCWVSGCNLCVDNPRWWNDIQKVMKNFHPPCDRTLDFMTVWTVWNRHLMSERMVSTQQRPGAENWTLNHISGRDSRTAHITLQCQREKTNLGWRGWSQVQWEGHSGEARREADKEKNKAEPMQTQGLPHLWWQQRSWQRVCKAPITASAQTTRLLLTRSHSWQGRSRMVAHLTCPFYKTQNFYSVCPLCFLTATLQSLLRPSLYLCGLVASVVFFLLFLSLLSQLTSAPLMPPHLPFFFPC